RYALLAAGMSTYFGGLEIRRAPQELRIWLLEMHAKQIDLLKIDWGQAGLCTEWDRDYDANTRSCGWRGKLTDRRFMFYEKNEHKVRAALACYRFYQFYSRSYAVFFMEKN